MRKAVILIAAAAGLTLAGCATKRGKALDEFAVARNAPLVIPPDYTLTPPVAGTIGISATDAQSQAIESSILDSAGRDRAPIGARSTAGDPATRVVDKGAATPAIIAAPVGNGQDASAATPK